MKTYTSTEERTQTTTVEVTAIDDNYSFLSHTLSEVRGKFKSGGLKRSRLTADPVTFSGVTSNDDLGVFLRGGGLKLDRDIIAITTESLDKYNRLHFTQAHESCEVVEFPDLPEDHVLVKFDYSSHMLFDLYEKPYPVGIYFDYIDASMSNGDYDLKLVLESLRERGGVRFIEDEIQNVPYYNNESGCRQFLEFMYVPTREEYIKLWDWCKSNGGEYPSTSKYRAIAALDLLGIEQFKIDRDDD